MGGVRSGRASPASRTTGSPPEVRGRVDRSSPGRDRTVGTHGTGRSRVPVPPEVALGAVGGTAFSAGAPGERHGGRAGQREGPGPGGIVTAPGPRRGGAGGRRAR